MVWLFDYDLTLYGHSEKAVLDSLDRNITLYIQQFLGLDRMQADLVRREFCAQYGTTLGGLRATRGTHPDHYFDFIHTQPGLVMPQPAPELRRLLLSLPGKRHIFTNGRLDWAQMGLQAMGIADCFTRIFDISWFDWKSKPDPEVYSMLVKELRLAEAKRVVMLDDKWENLVPARELGWECVLVHPDPDLRGLDVAHTSFPSLTPELLNSLISGALPRK